VTEFPFQRGRVRAITPGMAWTPALEVSETGDRCRLSLGGWAHGEGETLQQAADQLIARLLDIALRFRTSGYRFARALGRPTMDELCFVWELGEIAAEGGDIRPRVLGF
jgi:hypothetical protein